MVIAVMGFHCLGVDSTQAKSELELAWSFPASLSRAAGVSGGEGCAELVA